MKILDLCGTWKIRGSSGERGDITAWPKDQPRIPSYDAPVPGTVQEAMEQFTGDVNLGHNVYNARWIEEQKWHYMRTFELSEEDCARSVRLSFDALDLTAEVFVNGKKVGFHNNFYTPAHFDITSAVQPGVNNLSVIIESGLFWASDKPVGDLFCCGMAHPLTKRMWLRKPQSSFEWDWSPRCINVGIPKPCRVEISDGIFPNETKIFARLADDYASGTVDLTQYITAQKSGCEYTVTAEIPETGDTASVSGTANPGENGVNLKIPVACPELWYPRGYGEQKLYTVKITVTCGSGTFTVTKKTGFRTVEIDQSAHPVTGKYFILKVNGTPVFAKGGNMVPVDLLASRFTREAYEILIKRAAEANFNALRVWGGGLYENDDFYELCDEYGIVVWQDFVNACANYPADDLEFSKNIRAEYVHTVRRLSPHPSLCIYCGNNEIDWMMQSMPDKRRYPDAQLYYWVIPHVLKAEGEDRYYQPSSPYSPDTEDDNSPLLGDQHPWSIGFGDRDYFKYRNMVDRFPNEGGILGPASLPCMDACLGEGQKYIHSFDWQVHDNSIAISESSSADRILEEWLDLPGDGRKIDSLSVADYTYYGGFCQGEGLTEYILNFRRRMYSSASAIFWMYNDCWPTVRSWTIVDYLRNRTPSFHPVRRAFAPVTVDIAKEDGGYTVYGISERLEAKSAVLECGGFTPDGDYITAEMKVTLEPNASTKLTFIGNLPEGYIPYAILKADGEVIARRRFIDVRYYQLGLGEAEIRTERNGNRVTYVSDRLVLGVCIDLDGTDEYPADNFFDLYPGKPYTVDVGEKCSGEVKYAVGRKE